MATKLPRVIGLEELLGLRKSVRDVLAPLVYFSDKEFARLTEGATELKRRPGRGASLPALIPGRVEGWFRVAAKARRDRSAGASGRSAREEEVCTSAVGAG